MDFYYLDPRTELFQPDRRKSFVMPANERRRVGHLTGQSQYDFLRDCLLRRESAHDQLGVHERRARHLLVFAATIFVAIVFTGSQLSLRLTHGITATITNTQVAAAFPLVISYLILFACYLGARRLRLRHECRVIALELERFGCPTSYTVIHRYYDSTCDPPDSFWRGMVWPGPYSLVFRAHDLFLLATTLVLIVGSVTVAQRILSADTGHQWLAWAFTIYMAISGLAAFLAPLLLRNVRIRRRAMLDAYEARVRSGRGSSADLGIAGLRPSAPRDGAEASTSLTQQV